MSARSCRLDAASFATCDRRYGDWRLRALFRPPERRSLTWLGGAAVIFALLWAAEFSLFFQVL
jgi:hypothetical protein